MNTDPVPSPPTFDDARVGDVMHAGVLTCPPETPLTVVARMMAGYRVHAIVVTDLGEGEGENEAPWRVVSDLDLAKALNGRGFADRRAGGVAATEVITVGADEPLSAAAKLIAEHETAHVIVTGDSGGPVGVISTLDLARVAAAGAG